MLSAVGPCELWLGNPINIGYLSLASRSTTLLSWLSRLGVLKMYETCIDEEGLARHINTIPTLLASFSTVYMYQLILTFEDPVSTGQQ